MTDVTHILSQIESGDPQAAALIFRKNILITQTNNDGGRVGGVSITTQPPSLFGLAAFADGLLWVSVNENPLWSIHSER